MPSSFYAHPGVTGLDMAYEGVWLDRDLELSRVCAFGKPDVVYLDSESWGNQKNYLAYIAQSKNAQRRRRAGETDHELFYRLADRR
jgi:hypothetical protein